MSFHKKINPEEVDAKIAAYEIPPTQLKAISAPTDGTFPAFNASQGKFEWKTTTGKLSELIIDVDKNWAGKLIKNLGAPVDVGDAYSKGVTIDVGDIPNLDTSKIISGIFDLARIPRLDLTKMPLGSSDYFLKGRGASDSVYALLTAGDIPNLDASKIISGVFDLAQIPTMDDAHIPNVETLSYGGAFATAQIPSLDAGKITSGVFDLARIPTMDDAHIPNIETLSYGGAFADAQIPNLAASKITSGIFDLARIPTIAPSKLDAIDSPADGEFPSYNEVQGKFEWKTGGGGITKLSELTIDVSKDWAGYIIKNLGAPSVAGDVYSKGHAIDVGDIPNLDADKITTGIIDLARLTSIGQTQRITWDQTLDGFTVGGDAGYSIIPKGMYLYIATPATTNQQAYLYSVERGTFYHAAGKRYILDFLVYGLGKLVNQNIWLRLDNAYSTVSPPSETANHFGFKIIGQEIWGSCADGSAQTITDLGVTLGLFTAGVWHRLQAIFTKGSKIEFYVDGILKATTTTYLPANEYYGYHVQVKTLENVAAALYLGALVATFES